MARDYQYIIKVEFASKNKNTLLLDELVSYPFSKSYKDHFQISNKSIKIVASRSSKIELNSIFYNYNSALNKQIKKAISYYYCGLGEANKIRTIKVARFINNVLQDEKVFTLKNIKQIIGINSNLLILTQLDKNELKTLLEETVKGHAIFISVTHLIRACSFDNPFDQFDRLWKSFNALFKEITQKRRDADCLIDLKNHMNNNPYLYPLSTAEISPLNVAQIREKIRWNYMLLNDFPTDSKALELKGFIERMTDSRLISIMKSSLPLREVHLKSKGYYQAVTLHINNHTSTPVTSNIDLLGVLCLRYMYFVRNKTFHAEKLDSSFNLIPNNKEEQELAWCSNILKILVIDLINFNSKY